MWVMWNLTSFSLEIVLVWVQDWCTVCAKRTIGSENHFGHTRWYSYMTRLKWKLISIGLDIVLILTQDRCTVCIERTIGTDIVLDALDETPRWCGRENITSFRSEVVLVSVQDRCMVCTRRSIGSKIILDAPDGTTRWRGSSESSFRSFRIKC
jgi:hypothetical protein